MPEYSGTRVLLVDDDEILLKLLEVALVKGGACLEVASCLGEMHIRLTGSRFDAVFLDLGLGRECGLDAIGEIVDDDPSCKLVILTGSTDIEMAAQCMVRGASSVVKKRSSITETLFEMEKILGDVARHKRSPSVAGSQSFGIVGASASVMALRASMAQLAPVDSTVLILGESGTGKELVARGLHFGSPRKDRCFEALNCAAIPEALLESELFGHKRGAFTDAKTDRKGLFEVCSGGTLFLDEIGEMPLAIQAKLLRVLQERTIRPVGATTTIPIDTRIVAATNRNLGSLVRKGQFREDLFFRLSVIPLVVPPLRDRAGDVPLLTEHFLAIFNQKFGRKVRLPSPCVLAKLCAHSWTGNVRELQNAVERGVVLAFDDELKIENLLISRKDHCFESHDARQVVDESLQTLYQLPLTVAKHQFEKDYIKQVVDEAGGNISEAARRSGRYRTDLYRLIEKYGLDSERHLS
jgi:two-component system response regulator GlrR